MNTKFFLLVCYYSYTPFRYMHTHMYTHMYTHMHIHLYMHKHAHMPMYTPTHASCTPTRTLTCACTCTRLYITCACAHAYPHAHAHMLTIQLQITHNLPIPSSEQNSYRSRRGSCVYSFAREVSVTLMLKKLEKLQTNMCIPSIGFKFSSGHAEPS